MHFARKESALEKDGGFSLAEETIVMTDSKDKINLKKTNYCC